MVREFSAILLEVAPPHMHTDPWQLILVALSSQGHWKGNGQIPGQEPRVNSARGSTSVGPSRQEEQVRGGQSHPRAQPAWPPPQRGKPPLPGPFQAGVQLAVLDQRSQRGLCSEALCESPPHRAASL